jgi:hypothetical protein
LFFTWSMWLQRTANKYVAKLQCGKHNI